MAKANSDRPIKIVWKKTRSHWGYAIPAKRTIVVDPRLDDRTALEIINHEADHCFYPFLEETVVDENNRVRADLLFRAGFRRSHEGDE